MAIIKRPPHDDGPVNAGEQRLLDYLSVKLPNNYFIIPNCNIAITGPNRIMKYWEYDCIVVTPHALYHIKIRIGQEISKATTMLGSVMVKKWQTHIRQPD